MYRNYFSIFSSWSLLIYCDDNKGCFNKINLSSPSWQVLPSTTQDQCLLASQPQVSTWNVLFTVSFWWKLFLLVPNLEQCSQQWQFEKQWCEIYIDLPSTRVGFCFPPILEIFYTSCMEEWQNQQPHHEKSLVSFIPFFLGSISGKVSSAPPSLHDTSK